MILLTLILSWLFLWILGWGGFFLLRRWGIGYVKKPVLAFFYFYVLSGIIWIVFFKDFRLISTIPFIFICISIVVCIAVMAMNIFIKSKIKAPRKLIKQYPTIFMLQLDNKYVLSKTAEILFQQMLIILLVFWLYEEKYSTLLIITIFSAIFSLGHVYHLKTKGTKVGLIFIGLSLIAGIIFPLILLNNDFNCCHTFSIHWLFYMLTGPVIWILNHHNVRILRRKNS